MLKFNRRELVFPIKHICNEMGRREAVMKKIGVGFEEKEINYDIIISRSTSLKIKGE